MTQMRFFEAISIRSLSISYSRERARTFFLCFLLKCLALHWFRNPREVAYFETRYSGDTLSLSTFMLMDR